MEMTFRNATFGGFNRQDVMDYIAATARETEEKISALESELDALRAAAAERDAALETSQALKKQCDELEGALASATEERDRFKASAEEKAALETQLGELKDQAEEYCELKQHIAGIELDAHKRGDQVIGEAEKKAAQIIQEAEDYAASIRTKTGEELAELSARYQELLNTFEVDSGHVTGELRTMDVAVGQLPLAFNRLSAALRELKGEEK